MKKIITIIILVFAGATSFAQYNKPYSNNPNTGNYPNTGVYRDKDHDGDRDRDRDKDHDRDDWNNNRYGNNGYNNNGYNNNGYNNNGYNNNGYNNNGYNNSGYNRQREIEIARINQEFNNKVQAIQRNWFMSARQKSIRIQQAQMERDQQIQMVYGQYNGYNNNQAGRHDNRNNNNRYYH